MLRISLAPIMLLTVPLAACGVQATSSETSDVPPRPAEGSPQPFRAPTALTSEARTLLSKHVGQYGTRRTVAQMKQEVARRLLEQDVNNNGLSQADLYDTEREQASQRQTQAMGQLFASDYDGDGVVTKAEFDRTAERQRQRQEKRFKEMREQYPDRQIPRDSFTAEMLRAQTLFLNADANSDGKLTLLEAYRAPNEFNETYLAAAAARRDEVFALDFNKDGLVTRQEIEAGIDLFVKEAEAAGVVFPTESEVAQRTATDYIPRETQRQLAACKLPAPSRNAVVVRLSAYEGKQLANVTLSDQDTETTTSEIRIEPGNKPLYIVASSYEAQIWRFTGKVDRIEHVVLSGLKKNAYGQPAVGLTGLPRQKMSAVSPECVGGYHRSIDNGVLQRAINRTVDVQADKYGIAGLGVPSFREFDLPTLRPRYLMGNQNGVESAWQEFLRFNPAGLFTFDPAAVVSKSKAERYQVLPQQAGLTQLLISGAIVPGSDGYIVRKPMRFPGGLHGAHLTSFVVPKGVPKPAGDPGHSCVRIAGQSPIGPICRSR